jgi:hypothetical protein
LAEQLDGDLAHAGSPQQFLLTIMGRHMPIDVMEVPDDLPVLVGQIPLEYFDLVIDPRSRRLIGNPAHGGEHIFELL